MPSDGNSRSTATDPVPPPERLRRAELLEALRRLGLEAVAAASPGAVWEAVRAHLPDYLDADFAALRSPLFPEPRLWHVRGSSAGEVIPAILDLLESVRAPGIHALPGRRSAVVAPLPAEQGEDAGTLLVGWRGEPPPEAEAVEAAVLLAEQVAAGLANVARYERMRESALRRDRFFSAMSHDLRTPITAIVGYSELLQDGIVGELSRDQQEMVERISQVAGHLSQLVNDILDLAKLDAGRMEFHWEDVHLGDLVEEAMVAVEPQARSKRLPVRVEIGAHRASLLRIDPPRVRQILVNLLSNAVKFTDRGEVAVVAGEVDGRKWIEVRDTGPGLPDGSEEAVFEEFLQLAAGNRGKHEPGSGLGLAIARRLARAMGGDLVARRAPSTGASFVLYLPVVEAGG